MQVDSDLLEIIPPHDIPFWKWETKCRLGVEENLGVTSQKNYLIFFFYSVNLKFSISHGGGFFASKSILSENRPPLKLFKEHKSLVPGRNSKICFLFPGSIFSFVTQSNNHQQLLNRCLYFHPNLLLAVRYPGLDQCIGV